MRHVRHSVIREATAPSTYFILTFANENKFQAICLQQSIVSPISDTAEEAEEAVKGALSAAIFRAHQYAKLGKSVLITPAPKMYWDLFLRHVKSEELAHSVDSAFNSSAYHKEYAMV
ncbi:MAG: hypothetical protein JSR44_10365 [Spirochaetes bacterium]|nr:hypothetical protein [Spirochaetota bacterium]